MNKKIIQSVLIVVAYLTAFYGAIWVFNHLNGWLGIALILAILVTAIIHIINIISKH